MAWTQSDIDALKASIAKGEKHVSFGDRSVTYRDLDEMQAALAMMQTEVADAAGTPRPRLFLGYGSKGL